MIVYTFVVESVITSSSGNPGTNDVPKTFSRKGCGILSTKFPAFRRESPLFSALNGAADVNMSSLPTRQCVTFLVKDAHLPTKKKRSMTVRYHNAKHERW